MKLIEDATIWVAVACGGIVALLAPLFLKPLLARLGVFDIPNQRSSHARPTLRGCGLAQLLGLVVATVGLLWTLHLESDGRRILIVTLGAIAAGLLGLVDDLRGPKGLSVGVRLICQLGIGVALTLGCMAMSGYTWWGIIVFPLFFAGYINVANFMDGINGISGLHGIVVGAIYAAIGAITGEQWLLVLGVLIATLFLVFLPWNLTKPGAFLGDVGSYLLGAAIAGTAVGAVLSSVPWVAVVGPLAIYLTDTAMTAVKRLLTGENIFESHRDHVFQRLLAWKSSHVLIASIVAILSLLTGATGLLALRASTPWAFALLAVMLLWCALYWTLPTLAQKIALRRTSIDE